MHLEGYELNFEQIASEEMVQGSIEGAQGNLIPLKGIFTKLIRSILER